MNSGRSRLSVLKTKIELAWQKERDELQRLLAESNAANQELRNTMYQVHIFAYELAQDLDQSILKSILVNSVTALGRAGERRLQKATQGAA